jgi:hypothetical protein
MSRRAQALMVGAFAAVIACAHSPDNSRTSQTTTTGAGFTLPGSSYSGSDGVDTFTPTSSNPELADPAHPANRLGTAACERKQECDEIGDGKPHSSQQACLMKTRRHAHEELDKLSCENGLDAKAFEQCLKSVRIAECAMTDSIAKQDACAKHTLCTH